MDVDPKTAAEFGFPKLSYAALERERRWICDPPPPDLIIAAEVISDLYVGGAGLRLRKAEPTDGRQALFKLTRKRDLDSRRRLITTIYLEEPEHRFLSEVLSGERLQKRRHRLAAVAGAALAADEFLGPLRGLWLLEAEFAFAHRRARGDGRRPLHRGRLGAGWLAVSP